MIRIALAPEARALMTLTSSVQKPRCTSTMLSLTSGGKSSIEQPLRTVLLVGGGGSWMRLAGITWAVKSAFVDHVMAAKSFGTPIVYALGVGVTCSSTDGVFTAQV